MSEPRVALVVPAYNAALHLPRLFETVRAQHEPFDELVVCDDASTDDTAAVAEGLGARLVRHVRNQGCSAAKNSALQRVESPWVHFHDADDLLTPDFVASARAALRRDTVDAWLPAWHHVDARTGELLGASALDAGELTADPIAWHLTHTVTNVGVYRTALVSALGGFDVDAQVLYNEDRAFHLRLAMGGARFATSPVVGVITQRHAGSMSQGNAVRCLLAHAAITTRYVEARPGQHARACAAAFWQAATGLATHGAFGPAHALVARASALGFRADPLASPAFAAACRVNPHLALRLREYAVRVLKPQLRAGLPTP